MPVRVFVSPDPTAAFDDSWEHVGTLDTEVATINERAAKTLHTNQSGGSARLEIYLSGDPINTGIAGMPWPPMQRHDPP